MDFFSFSGLCIVSWAFPFCGEDLTWLPDLGETLGGWKLDSFFSLYVAETGSGPTGVTSHSCSSSALLKWSGDGVVCETLM